ncbi:MAG: sigma-54 dependent transcriptional regulator [Burkholderiaceae bacterium]|nr:sigma-54 dependent transcriptional regulator [Burkholderiaceae bacterium]MEB2352334.1 sigma-54 dependent transcriptional regulator [Burkholderiaceae bacterium]
MNTLLIVDDDHASCRTLQLHFRTLGHEAHVAHSAVEALAARGRIAPELVILDVRMPGRSGLEALPEIKQAFPGAHVIVITAFHDMETTIQAMQRGADDYIQKPVDLEELNAAVAKALRYGRGEAHGVLIASAEHAGANRHSMVGHSRAMKEVFKTIGLAASSGATVLITGESGTGKELVARAIHRTGPNPGGPFVAVNCAALVETLLESDMFGHEKGAFTGAVERRAGKFAAANHGTLFLDEVSELSHAIQAKLLRALQEKEFVPLGAREPQTSDARVIAATNVDLANRVRDGSFREDLYYRLQVINIHLPPLRERRDDLPELVQTLLARINREMRRHVWRVDPLVMRCFEAYAWPGNVRELENALMKAVALCPANMITCDLLPGQMCTMSAPSGNAAVPGAHWRLRDVEKQHVLRVLEATGWHRGRACELLGVSRPRLRRLIRQFELPAPPDAAEESDEHENNAQA